MWKDYRKEKPNNGDAVIALNEQGDCKLCYVSTLPFGKHYFYTGYESLSFNCGYYNIVAWMYLPENTDDFLPVSTLVERERKRDAAQWDYLVGNK